MLRRRLAVAENLFAVRHKWKYTGGVWVKCIPGHQLMHFCEKLLGLSSTQMVSLCRVWHQVMALVKWACNSQLLNFQSEGLLL